VTIRIVRVRAVTVRTVPTGRLRSEEDRTDVAVRAAGAMRAHGSERIGGKGPARPGRIRVTAGSDGSR